MAVYKTKVLLTSDGEKIAVDHYDHGHTGLAIIAPGFFNSKDALLLKELGAALTDRYDVMLMDFRGHGQSSGLFHWTSKEFLDLGAVIDEAKKNYKKIAVIGFSLGAATSLITASQTEGIATVIAVSPPVEFEKIEYYFWQLDPENDIAYSLFGQGRTGKGVRPGPFWLKKEKPADRVAGIRCPVFYIHGAADWLIKPWHSEALYQKTLSHKRLAIIKNGPHAEYLIRKNKEETVGLIREWLNEIFR